jgi:hypothetical protein
VRGDACFGPGERRYDSFVVRLWREEGTVRLLRVAVEHVQSDAVASARGVGIEWIGVRIAELLRDSTPPPCLEQLDQ